MIDTIVLMLGSNEFEITDPDKFSPSAANLLGPPYPRLGKGAIFKCVQNPSAEDMKAGNYKPRLTLILRPCKITRQMVLNLKIEFSVPKFYKGNNFDELTDDDFGIICPLLTIRLGMMGVRVASDAIPKATVSAVHYSKNFVLHDHVRCRHVLDELKKMDAFARLDVTEKDYRNDGHLVKWHANSYEVCLYDKIKDLTQARTSPKRALEKDQHSQLAYLPALIDSQAQVLRLEVRLTKVKMKKLFAELEIKPDFTFQKIFSARLSQKILNHFWTKIVSRDGMQKVLKEDLSNPQLYLERLQSTYPALKPKDLMSVFGATLIMQQVGEGGFKAAFQGKQQKSVARLMKQAKTYQPSGSPRWMAAEQVAEQLLRFKPSNLKDLTGKAAVAC